MRILLSSSEPRPVPQADASNCTGAYVGRLVSDSGRTILARTVDLHPANAIFTEQVVPRVTQSGRVLKGVRGFSWPLPETTWRYVATPMAEAFRSGRFASACMNEKGLALTGTVTGYISPEIDAMDPEVPGGLCEEVVADLVAACCATAREGVELIGRVMKERGSCERNIIMLADRAEAWYVETYTGHQWCAVRMPEDRMAVYGNEFMLGAVDPADDGVLCADTLFSAPEAAGLAVYDGQGRMLVAETYAGRGRLADYANRRTYTGRRLFSPASAGEYETRKRYPLFFTPEKPVSVKDLMELFRCRYEGTADCPDENGRGDIRVIGTETQGTEHILEVDHSLPAELCLTGWLCLANSEHSVYLPVNGCQERMEGAYCEDVYDGSPASAFRMAGARFKRLCALAEQDRARYGKNVRAYFAAMEDELLGAWPRVTAEAARMYASDPAAAKAFLTEHTLRAQKNALEAADRMFDQLLWFVMEHTDTLKTAFSYKTLTMSEKEPEVFVPDAGKEHHAVWED